MALLNLAGPAGLTIAEGILVIYADDESFCFISAEGHMFGGMITFSAHAENGTTVAQVDALLRAGDPLFEITVRLGIATKPEDWAPIFDRCGARSPSSTPPGGGVHGLCGYYAGRTAHQHLR